MPAGRYRDDAGGQNGYMSYTEPDALLPHEESVQRRCRRCGHLVPRGPLFEGYGIDCAVRLGLLPGTARVRAARQDGPDLFDQLEEGRYGECDEAATTAVADPAVALVHVFACLGRFGSEQEAIRSVEATYTADGAAVLPPFLREIGLTDHEPAGIEVVHAGADLPIRQLLRDVSYGDQWVARLEPDRRANTAVCVFAPNRVARPQTSSWEYCGAFPYSP